MMGRQRMWGRGEGGGGGTLLAGARFFGVFFLVFFGYVFGFRVCFWV